MRCLRGTGYLKTVLMAAAVWEMAYIFR